MTHLGIDSEWQLFLQEQSTQDVAFTSHNFVSINSSNVKKRHKCDDTDDDCDEDNTSSEDDDDDDETSTTSSTTITEHESDADMRTNTKHSSISTVETQIPPVENNPKGICEELYISTQTKIFFLNQSNLDVQKIFWNTKVIPYSTATNGVIKKQIRFISKTREEFQQYETKRNKELFYTEKIMKQIDNPNARKIKFKDVRKLTVGVSK